MTKQWDIEITLKPREMAKGDMYITNTNFYTQNKPFYSTTKLPEPALEPIVPLIHRVKREQRNQSCTPIHTQSLIQCITTTNFDKDSESISRRRKAQSIIQRNKIGLSNARSSTLLPSNSSMFNKTEPPKHRSTQREFRETMSHLKLNIINSKGFADTQVSLPPVKHQPKISSFLQEQERKRAKSKTVRRITSEKEITEEENCQEKLTDDYYQDIKKIWASYNVRNFNGLNRDNGIRYQKIRTLYRSK